MTVPTRRRLVDVVLLLAVLILLVAPVYAQPPQGPQGGPQATPTPAAYRLTFDNYVVSAPSAFGANVDLDVLVHSRDSDTWETLNAMEAEHGAECNAPPAMHHQAGSYSDAVFGCAGGNAHLMTALNASGYGVIYLMPGAMMDWSTGESVLRFDVSTLRASGRDWWDIWISPYDEMLAAPLESWLPDLQGNPRRALQVRMDWQGGKTTFRVHRVDDHVSSDVETRSWLVYEDVIVPSATRRDTFELRVSRTRVGFALVSGTTGQPLMSWADTPIADLGWDRGVVQIGHHSYNPMKDCAVPPGTTGCRPGTWHWDTLSISRAQPLTILPAKERRANDTRPIYTFVAPAPEDATLHVLALADQSLELSLDGGTTWTAMTPRFQAPIHWGGRASYAAPIPAGTTAVTLRGRDQTGNPWDANHAVVLSPKAREPNPPTPTVLPPTRTPFPTETPRPTNTAGPTSTPVPLPTDTPTPVPAQPTGTPAPVCYAVVQRDPWNADPVVERYGTPIPCP